MSENEVREGYQWYNLADAALKSYNSDPPNLRIAGQGFLYLGGSGHPCFNQGVWRWIVICYLVFVAGTSIAEWRRESLWYNSRPDTTFIVKSLVNVSSNAHHAGYVKSVLFVEEMATFACGRAERERWSYQIPLTIQRVLGGVDVILITEL